ncbi:MAG: hypothetical protein HZA50_10305 [Planctomycetes bacterium]|nr:hypothetical protein [Planctomycetota bacterium]
MRTIRSILEPQTHGPAKVGRSGTPCSEGSKPVPTARYAKGETIRRANIFWIPSLLFCLVFYGCSHSSEDKTWVSATENGDKPGTAFVLTEKDGKVAAGKFFILDPKYPRDLSKGKGYNLENLTYENKTIKCKVSLIDESSTTKTKDFNLTITLKSEFRGSKVEAELDTGGVEKMLIVFERSDNSESKR